MCVCVCVCVCVYFLVFLSVNLFQIVHNFFMICLFLFYVLSRSLFVFMVLRSLRLILI